jgi:hypothetical protein
LWSDIIDQPGALHSKAIEQSEKFLGIGRIAFHIGVVPAAALHQLMGGRLHHVVGHDVNVNVYDRLQKSPSFVEGSTITRRY